MRKIRHARGNKRCRFCKMGQATLSIEDGENDIDISRSANAEPEGLERGCPRPLIFPQKNVESIGLSSRGRLNIVDLFLPDIRRSGPRNAGWLRKYDR